MALFQICCGGVQRQTTVITMLSLFMNLTVGAANKLTELSLLLYLYEYTDTLHILLM